MTECIPSDDAETRVHTTSSRQTVRRTPHQKTRSDAGRILLQPRDLWALRWIAEQKALRYDQIADLFGLWQGWQEADAAKPLPATSSATPYTFNAVRRVASRWCKLGYARTEKPFALEPPWVWVTQKGVRELGLPYETRFPMLDDLAHIAAINTVRFRLARSKTYAAFTWRSERAIFASREEGTRDVAYGHTPDGELYAQGEAEPQVAVEVELTRKSYARLDAILRELTATYPQVLYVVTEQTRNVLLEACACLEPAQQQQITLLTF